MWYKYPLIINNNKEIIFRLTSNKQPSDTLIGDRTMTLVKETVSTAEFSTYSLSPFTPKVPYPCLIPDLSLHSWTFIYMAYSKPQMKLFYYLKADEYECKAEV